MAAFSRDTDTTGVATDKPSREPGRTGRLRGPATASHLMRRVLAVIRTARASAEAMSARLDDAPSRTVLLQTQSYITKAPVGRSGEATAPARIGLLSHFALSTAADQPAS